MEIVTQTCLLPVSVSDSFAWHTRPGAFERQIPPWTKIKILEKQGTIYDGDVIKIKYFLSLFSFVMKMKHQNYKENSQFESVQQEGPFREFRHSRSFEAVDNHTSKITDRISFESSYKFWTRFLGHAFLTDELESFFSYGHRTVLNDLKLHAKYSQTKFKVMITGASGFVGRELTAFLTSGGHTVLPIKHETYVEQMSHAEGFDAIIHLAGENIASHKWTEERKKVLVESRVEFTKQLLEQLKKLKTPPKVFISASGIGIFDKCSTPDGICDETSEIGDGFLAKLAEKWECAANEAKQLNMRVVNLRFGSILSSSGGMLKKISASFKFFIGGTFGQGHQRMPWVSMTDVLGIVLFALSNERVNGPINVVAPQIVSNHEFTEQVAEILSRPNAFRIPEIMIEALFGEMGRELFLSDIAAKPQKLNELGYVFLHPRLNDALFHYLDT
jgi:uncharacterized protein (TIGR01777 family)